MIAYKYDQNGAWIPGKEIEAQSSNELPVNFTTIPLPQPCWKPYFLNGKWVEKITQDELKALPSVESRPSELEVLKKQQADLIFTLMMNGVI